VSVRVDQPGAFDGACSEYCGTQHAWMRIMVVAHADDQFDAWARAQVAPPPVAQDPLARRGQELFASSTCINCHTVAGLTVASQIGPDLSHVGSRATIGAGVAPRNPDTLEQWIRDPHAIKPGVLMPGYAGLGQSDLAALAAYLDALK
jgi:cytochrome c oxidase subunit 2